MLTGTVTADREARLDLHFSGPDAEADFQAVIDTGFNGFLTLPFSLIEKAGLQAFGQRLVTLGDGSEVFLSVYEANLQWSSQTRTVSVLASDGDPVIGMSLLYGFRLTMDIVDGGPVTIESLP